MVEPGSVSGTLVGPCSNIALSQLNKCECVDHSVVPTDDDDYDYLYDEGDISGLIDVRINANGNGPQVKIVEVPFTLTIMLRLFLKPV